MAMVHWMKVIPLITFYIGELHMEGKYRLVSFTFDNFSIILSVFSSNTVNLIE